MDSWLAYLKKALSRELLGDRIAPDKAPGARTNLDNLRPFVNRHWRKGLLGAILVAVTTLLNFPQPLLMRYLVDRGLMDRQIPLLIGAVLFLAAIALFEKLATLLQQFYFTRLQQDVIFDIQHTLLDRVLRFPKSFFDTNETGYLMSRLSSDVDGLRWFFSGTLVYVIGNALRFAGGLGLLFYLEWRMALGVVVVLPGLVFVVRYFSRKMYVLSHQGMEQHANLTSRFQESLCSVPLVKAYASEGRTLSRVAAELKKSFQISIEQSVIASAANVAINIMPSVARAIALVLGGYWVIRGRWTLGSLFAFQVYLGYVFGPAQFLASANLDLQNAWAALQRVSALFDLVPEENLGTGEKVERLRGKVEFREVSFSYGGRDSVLKNVSLLVRPGEHVGIVGPSGVGKTTLVSLILRFYRPTSGEIYFDGRPASGLELGSLRQRIGYVSQSALLLSGTILENLRLGNPDASKEEVVRAARQAGIHDFISCLPAGYDTEIGENGVNLSLGQKQRLALARALAKDPDILVLDEPTSAIDALTEKTILEEMPDSVRGRTLFVVAHRLSTLHDCDRILLLNEKRLVAIGTHQSLLEMSDYYRTVVACQAMNS